MHRGHIVVTESLEPLVEQVRASFSFQNRPKNKSVVRGGDSLDLAANDDAERDVEDNRPAIEVVEKTFLSWKPRPKLPHQVTQSTTEARNVDSPGYLSHHRGVNPRRLVPDL